MKFSWFSRLALMAVLSLAVYSCDKDNPEPPPPPPPVEGGAGGEATLRVVPMHRGMNIDSCMVYIKYNSLDMPSSFDDSVYCTVDSNDKYSAYFRNLKAGNYFLFAKGWNVYTSEKVEDYLYHIIENNAVYQTIEMPLRVK